MEKVSGFKMSFNALIFFLLAACITGFFYGFVYMHHFKNEGGIPGKILDPKMRLSQEAIAAKKRALIGFGVFIATLAIMLALTSIFGPASP